MPSSLPRIARMFGLVVCGGLALLLMGLPARAFAEKGSIVRYPEARKEHELIADNWGGNVEREPEYVLPAGAYDVFPSLGGTGDGIYEYTEECEHGEILKECEGLSTVVTQNSEESPLPKKFVKLQHLTIESDYHGRRTVTENRWAWKPSKRRRRVRHRERFGLKNAAEQNVRHPCKKDPVECATGNEVEAQTDISVPALGVPFELERTYNSQEADSQSSPGLFGYGWSASFTDHLELDTAAHVATVVQANGSTVVFFGNVGTPGEFTGPSWDQAKLVYIEAGTYRYTLPDQETFTFDSAGQLLSESERNGNVTTVSYNEEEDCEGGCHKVLKSIVIADPAGRKITLTLNGSGEVESTSDPMGHTVKYAYEGGDLVSVTEPGESSARWKYKYNGAHEMTEMVNGLGGKTTTEYNGSDQVVSQTSPLNDTTHFAYEEIASKMGGVIVGGVAGEGCTSEEIEEEECEETEEVINNLEEESGYYAPPPEQETTITDEATGAIEKEHFNGEDELESVTHAYGTANSTTEEFTYSSSYEMTSRTDGDKHTTKYGYDGAGDETSEKNADGDETKWEYNSTHDLTGITNPNGEKTTIERDGNGNAIKVSRPAPGETTQATKYKYAADGELESMTNPLGKEWKYEYDGYGDRTGETDPEGIKQTWGYNEDSQETSTVSARGHASGAKESSFTTTIERNTQGQPTKVTNPLGQTTKYTYNADGDVETETNGESHATTYSYNAEDEPTKVEAPNKAITETAYNKDGEVVSRTDGNKHTTKYERNILGEVTEEVNALSKKTTREYDAAGNLTSVTDAAKRTASYKYDPANRLTEVSYSSGSPSAIKYEYNEDGDRTKMTDGTGETTDTFDQLDRLTESEDGHGDTVKYEYNLANEAVKITYPSGKAITRTYDNDARLKSVEDWLEHTTSFAYNQDSELNKITFPTATGDADTDAYNDADAMIEVTMKKSSEVLASLVYTRNKDGDVTKATSKGLPGEETPVFSYDEDSRLTKGPSGAAYKYDAANNPTEIEKSTYAYNAADELEKAANSKKETLDTYAFNEVGQRTKTTPASGPATSYGYDQAGELTSVERPKEGETPEIKDTYTYNGEELRASQTINATTSYLTWDTAETELPLILNDGTNSYIYGPGDLPIEQINNTTGAVLYLHHDQQGSTRLLTGSTGKTEGAYSYSAYGTPEHTGTATTLLGYDGQYTSSDTGLIYMRARVYDPATAQFLTRDPLAAISGEPYSYTGDNPLNNSDPTGLLFGISLPSLEEIGEGIAGWGDTITFGGTEWVREQLGDNNIDACSGAYEAGGYAGLVTGVLIPGEGEAEIGVDGLSISAKIARQMEARGWTEEEIQEAISSGEQVPAVNKATGDPATRYINPKTGQSVVIDNGTKEVIHVGGPGFKYGPESGDLP
jgi:RHS repeat-associated protein